MTKANALQAYAFFRSICDEVHQDYGDVEIEYAYVDALTLNLDKRPDCYDGIDAENLFGDIIPDLCTETLGDSHALFHGVHGFAPDIAGQNAPSLLATALSGATMLRWLPDRKDDTHLSDGPRAWRKPSMRFLPNPNTFPATSEAARRVSR